jgi:hypothetical protein
MPNGHEALREKVYLLRGSLRALAHGTPSDRQYQDFASLIDGTLEAYPSTDIGPIRAQTLRVRARALMAYRRHRFVDEAMGEEAVATTLKSCEAVLDLLLRELTNTKAAATGPARNVLEQSDPLGGESAVEAELSPALGTRPSQGFGALRELEAALTTLSTRARRH